MREALELAINQGHEAVHRLWGPAAQCGQRLGDLQLLVRHSRGEKSVASQKATTGVGSRGSSASARAGHHDPVQVKAWVSPWTGNTRESHVPRQTTHHQLREALAEHAADAKRGHQASLAGRGPRADVMLVAVAATGLKGGGTPD